MVAITGQVASSLIGTDAFQEVDTYGLSIPITKQFPCRIGARIAGGDSEKPSSWAMSGRPAESVDIPKDVQNERIEAAEWPTPGARSPVPLADAKGIDRAAAMINAAAQPILYLGGGGAPGASRRVVELAEKANLPTVMTLMALGAMPVDHPLSLGMLGMHGARCTNMAIEECDLLIAVGARFE